MEHRLTGTLSKLLAAGQNHGQLPSISSGSDRPLFLTDLSHELYHADKTRMSSTAVRKLLRSPRNFLNSWFDIEKDIDDDEDHFRIGRAAHMMLLEPDLFRKRHVVMPLFEGLTKEGKMSAQSKDAKDKRAAWIAQQEFGSLIVTQPELDMLIGMIEAVLEHPVANGMLSKGKPECSVHWTDPATGVMCKARPDFILEEANGDIHLVDFKTTRDIRPGIFAYDIERYGYHTQLAFYHDGIVAALGKQPQSITLVVVEKNAPYEAAVYPLHDDWFEEGQRQYRHALQLYKKCREQNKWPAFQSNAQMLNMPNRHKDNSLPEFGF